MRVPGSIGIVLVLAVLTLMGCEESLPPPGHVAEPRERWTIAVIADTPVLAPVGAEQCLAPVEGETIAMGEELEPLAYDGRFWLLDEGGRVIAARDAEELWRPDVLPTAERRGVAGTHTERWAYDAEGCPGPAGSGWIAERTEVEIHARSHDASYRGFVVIDRALGLAPVRQIDSEGWVYPWHATVQLIRPLPDGGGFVIGGGVLVGPRSIATARHMGLGPEYCYSRHATSGWAWYAGEFTCGNVAAPQVAHPEGIDVAVATLIEPEPPPYATLREDWLVEGEEFYTARTSTLNLRTFADGVVFRVFSVNADCLRWPASSTFSSTEHLVQGGDSGGPAFAGDELVGIVHGSRCRFPWEEEEHVWVHVPRVHGWIREQIP